MPATAAQADKPGTAARLSAATAPGALAWLSGPTQPVDAALTAAGAGLDAAQGPFNLSQAFLVGTAEISPGRFKVVKADFSGAATEATTWQPVCDVARASGTGFNDLVGIASGACPAGDRAGAVGAVPEPSTWTLAIAGFGMIGSAIRRRRLAAARTAPS